MATASEDNKPVTPSGPTASEESKTEGIKDISPPSVFVNSEPIREDQIQNAMKFLSHPKVQGSPVMYRRSFLEKKGLTKEEIDEAFRRVPDQAPTTQPTTQPTVTTQDVQQKASSNIQTLQPVKAGPLYQFHWSHALLAVGVLAVSGAGTAVLFKKSIIPKLKTWIRKVVSEEEEGQESNLKPTIAEEATLAAKAAASAAAEVARTSQELLDSKIEEKKYFAELTKMLDFQVREMKSMSNAIHKLEVQGNSSRNIHAVEHEDYRSSRQTYATNGKHDSRSVRSLSPPATVEPPPPKSYMEIMAMVQRGEKPPNVRDINDMPPNPNQPIPNPRTTTKPKPWEVGPTQYSSNNSFPYQIGSEQQQLNNENYQENNNNNNNQSKEYSSDWWQRRNIRVPPPEIETEEEKKNNERPTVRRSSWVPPQPPPVVMAEAAAAIRQPKKSITKDDLNDDELLGRGIESSRSDVTDELQRITKISETGGVSEGNGESLSEIQVEENSYLEA